MDTTGCLINEKLMYRAPYPVHEKTEIETISAVHLYVTETLKKTLQCYVSNSQMYKYEIIMITIANE